MKRDPRDDWPDDLAGSVTFCAEEGYGVSITGEYRKKTITDRLVAVLRERERVGHKTYNKPLWGNEKTLLEWLYEARDEVADHFQYLEAAISVLEKELKEERDG